MTSGIRADGLTAALLTLVEAEALVPAWRHLAETAIEPNVFYGPEIALAAFRHLPGGARTRIAAAWRLGAAGRNLVGLWAVSPGRGRYLNHPAAARAADFTFTLSTPLLAPDRPLDTWEALLACLAKAGIAAIAAPHLSGGGPVAEVLRALSERGHAVAQLGAHRRALLRSELDGPAYFRVALKSAKRNKLDRQRRKLAEIGPLALEVATEPAALERALAAFLALEASGWKGASGTALAVAPGAAAFAEEAVRELGADGRIRLLALRAGDRVVASWLVAIAQRRAYCLKIAYDESLARFSPGVLLALDATANLLADPAIDDADSIAIAGHPMIDGIWTERFAVASVVIATAAGAPGWGFRLAVAVERGREAAIARIKSWRDRRSRSEGGAPPA